MLLKCGADPNAKQSNGLTPLHFAAKIGSIEIVQLLLNYNGDPRIQSEV